MKFISAIFPVVLLLIGNQFGLAQGFVNLDFEAAHNLPASSGLVSVADALPGWAAFAGTSQLSVIQYNPPSIAPFGPVDLVGSNAYVITGNFSVAITVKNGGGSISQTGLIPADAESLLFKSDISSYSTFVVSLNGQGLPYLAVSSGSNYTLYGVDISAFAGQTATLSFLATLHGGTIDDIQFSSSPIPEPSELALGALGALLLGFRRWRNSSR